MMIVLPLNGNVNGDGNGDGDGDRESDGDDSPHLLQMINLHCSF